MGLFYSPLLTHYIESDAFRAAMEKETAKGLHFPLCGYSPIRRTSAFTAQSDSFEARNGEKAMKSLDARGITATFDPLGVFVRQWRFADVHVDSGDVEIQIYKANPEAVAPKPWFAIFLPNRVYLKRIETPQANITWQFRGETAGFFGTQLLITPHGSDFEYVATSGRLRMALLPDLDLRRAHLLITKTLLTIYDVDLASDSSSGESIHAQANAGIGKDKSVDLRATFNQVPIVPGYLLNGKCSWPAALSATCTGRERIQSWKALPARVRCTSVTVELRTSRFWKSSQSLRRRNHSNAWS